MERNSHSLFASLISVAECCIKIIGHERHHCDRNLSLRKGAETWGVKFNLPLQSFPDGFNPIANQWRKVALEK